MVIDIPSPFDTTWLLAYLRARQASAVERIGDDRVTRAIRVEGRPAVLDLAFHPSHLIATCSVPMPTADLRALVTRMLDLDADVAAFARQVQRDRVLGRLVRARPGLRVLQFLDPFECVMRAVLGQQVSVRAATTLFNRVVVASRADVEAGVRAGPTAAELASFGPEQLQRLGIMPARAVALHKIAVAIAEGRVDFEALRAAPGGDAQAALVALPGIGPWTASYIRMRALADRDAFPAADLGVLKALKTTAVEAERRSKRWSPWRAYATMYLWAG